MTPAEIDSLLVHLGNYYGRTISTDTQREFHRALGPLEVEQVLIAAEKHVDASRFFPVRVGAAGALPGAGA